MFASRITAASLLALLVVGCGPALPTDDSVSDTDALSQEVLTTWPSVKANGITVWISPAITPVNVDGQPRWLISGRTSRNLDSVFSWVPDDGVGQATVLSPRKFEVALSTDELRLLTWGRRLLVRISPTTGSTTYQVALGAAPSFVAQEGATRINLHPEIVPVVMGHSLVFRGKASTTSTMSSFEVSSFKSFPLVTKVSARTWTFDWTHEQLAKVASAGTNSVTQTATSTSGEKFVRTGTVGLRVGSLAITTGDPYEAFPLPTCSASVKSCLQSLTDPNLDTQECGSAVAVLACGGVSVQAMTADRFASDLRASLVDHYAKFGADIAQAGGATLSEAQAAVSSKAVSEMMELNDDPFAHDLSRVRVFRHADVVFPGSGNAWFGAYDRATGALLEIYDFN